MIMVKKIGPHRYYADMENYFHRAEYRHTMNKKKILMMIVTVLVAVVVVVVVVMVEVVAIMLMMMVTRIVRPSLKSLQIRRADLFHLEEYRQVMTTGMIMLTTTKTMMLTVMMLIGMTRFEIMILPLQLIVEKHTADPRNCDMRY